MDGELLAKGARTGNWRFFDSGGSGDEKESLENSFLGLDRLWDGSYE